MYFHAFDHAKVCCCTNMELVILDIIYRLQIVYNNAWRIENVEIYVLDTMSKVYHFDTIKL